MGKNSNTVQETAQEKALAKVAAEQWNDYQARYKPFENKYMADVLADTAGREAKVKGMVNADVAQKLTQKPSAINPNSGKMQAGKESLDRANALARGQVAGEQAVKDQQTGAMQTLIDMGRGQATQAQQGMSSLAGAATQEAISSASNRMQTRSAIGSAIGSAVGAGAGMLGGMGGGGGEFVPDGYASPMGQYSTSPNYSQAAIWSGFGSTPYGPRR